MNKNIFTISYYTINKIDKGSYLEQKLNLHRNNIEQCKTRINYIGPCINV